MGKLESIRIIPLESLPKHAFLEGKATLIATLTPEEVEAIKKYRDKASKENDNVTMDELYSRSR